MITVTVPTAALWSVDRYRFAEIRYFRPESKHKDRVQAARVETVVLFLPDVWTCSPTRLEWDSLQQAYQKQLQMKLNPEAAQQQAQCSLLSVCPLSSRGLWISSPCPLPPDTPCLFVFMIWIMPFVLSVWFVSSTGRKLPSAIFIYLQQVCVGQISLARVWCR